MKNQKGYTLIELLFVVIFGVGIILGIGVVVTLVMGAKEVSDKGLKGVVERVWEGKKSE